MRQTQDPSPAARPPLLERPGPAALFALAALLVAASAARAVRMARQDRLHLSTGAARWIWWTHDLPNPSPLRFYATRSFALANPPGSARIRIFVDRRWELSVNGERLGSGEQRPRDRASVVDASGRLRAGENRIVIAAEHPTGAGGILFGLDLGDSANAVVSDSSWRVTLSESEARAGRGRPAVVWGKPPMHPWGYP